MITQIKKGITPIKRILVVRTDRIGEVLLTTPILTALKEALPEAKVSMMVKPEVKELVEDNPCVSEIIEYGEGKIGEDKGGEGKIRGNKGTVGKVRGKKGWIRKAFRLKNILKERNFDAVIIVNPKKEFHLAAFLAGIPVRVGFDRKWGFLLTHKVKDLKCLAQKHEIEYNLDLVRALGIEPHSIKPVLYIKEECPISAPGGEPLIAIHPCTSNPKKQWPRHSFAKLADMLARGGNSIVWVSGPDEAAQSRRGAVSLMKGRSIDLSGKTSLKGLAALLKKCRFLVSGDSGPVHIAAAVGTPVVAIFGTSDPGSNPTRWGPYGAGHIVIQKDRLEDITPEEVYEAIAHKL